MTLFQKGISVVYIIRVSELKQASYRTTTCRLVKNLPEEIYLVHEQSQIQLFYYGSSSAVRGYEQALIQADEEVADFTVQLNIPSKYCLRVPCFFLHVSLSRLQCYLVRRLKRPVKLLTMAEKVSWPNGFCALPYKQNPIQEEQRAIATWQIALVRSSVLF